MIEQGKSSCVEREFVPFVPRIVDRDSVLFIDTSIDFRSRCEISPVELGRGRYEVQCSIYHVRERNVLRGGGFKYLRGYPRTGATRVKTREPPGLTEGTDNIADNAEWAVSRPGDLITYFSRSCEFGITLVTARKTLITIRYSY
jgi:hypothetical protein